MSVKALGRIGRTLIWLLLRPLAWPLGLLGSLMLRIAGTQPVDLRQPPNEADLSALAHWLSLHRPHHGELADIHALDGYLCCVAIGPKVSMPGKWLGLMFGDHRRLPKDFELMLAVMARHMNHILDGCSQQPCQYRLLCQTHPHLAAADAQPLRSWCRGFVIGMKLAEAGWQAPFLDAQATRWLESVKRAAESPKTPLLQPHTVAQGAARLSLRALQMRAVGSATLRR